MQCLHGNVPIWLDMSCLRLKQIYEIYITRTRLSIFTYLFIALLTGHFVTIYFIPLKSGYKFWTIVHHSSNRYVLYKYKDVIPNIFVFIKWLGVFYTISLTFGNCCSLIGQYQGQVGRILKSGQQFKKVIK